MRERERGGSHLVSESHCLLSDCGWIQGSCGSFSFLRADTQLYPLPYVFIFPYFLLDFSLATCTLYRYCTFQGAVSFNDVCLSRPTNDISRVVNRLVRSYSLFYNSVQARQTPSARWASSYIKSPVSTVALKKGRTSHVQMSTFPRVPDLSTSHLYSLR